MHSEAFNAGIADGMEKVAIFGLLNAAKTTALRAAPVVSRITHAAAGQVTPTGSLVAGGAKALGEVGSALKGAFLSKDKMPGVLSKVPRPILSRAGRHIESSGRMAGNIADALG